MDEARSIIYIQEHNGEGEVEVRLFIVNEKWDSCKLKELLYEEITNYILKNIIPRMEEGARNTTWWMGQPGGACTAKLLMRVCDTKRRNYGGRVRFGVGIYLSRLIIYFFYVEEFGRKNTQRR